MRKEYCVLNLDNYRKLGLSELMVSPLCLGTMNFNRDFGEKAAQELVDHYLAAGGNFIDTANVYGEGTSEEFLGRILKGRRKKVILATKCRWSEKGYMDNTHITAGLSPKAINAAVEGSLKRLQTDYIDLYQVHAWDKATPLEETMGALHRLVERGLVRSIGMSNFTAWQLSEAMAVSRLNQWHGFVSGQMQYSLIVRDIETGIKNVMERHGLGLICWSPLAGGMLTGKYVQDKEPAEGTRYGSKSPITTMIRKKLFTDESFKIVNEVISIARAKKILPLQVALAWLLKNPMVTSIIIGPNSLSQLMDNLASLNVSLGDEEMEWLNRISEKRPATYPENMGQ